MENKNKTNNNKKKNMNNAETKTKVSSRSRVVVGLVTALVVATAIGSAIFFAGVVPPAGCQKQDDDTYKCDFSEAFTNNSNIDKDKTDDWMQIDEGHLVLNPSEQIKLRKGQEFSDDDKPAQQICGTFCTFGECTDQISIAQMSRIVLGPLKKNNQNTPDASLNFVDARLGKNSSLPYELNTEFFRPNGNPNDIGMAIFDSSNPDSAIVYNDFFGSSKPSILPISPGGRTELRANTCGQTRETYFLPVDSEGFSDFNPVNQAFDTRFIQGATVSKDVSTNLNDKYNITSADFNPQIANLDGVIFGAQKIRGMVLILASNNNGNTWYIPSEYSIDQGQTWKQVGKEDFFIDRLADKRYRFNFTNSEGHNLKWAAVIQSDDNNLHEQREINAGDRFENLGGMLEAGGGADDFDIGMTNSEIFDINTNTHVNPMTEKQLIAGGIMTAGQAGNKTYYFMNRAYWPNYSDAAIQASQNFNENNVIIESLTPEIVQVFDASKGNKTIVGGSEDGANNDQFNVVDVVIGGIKPGYGKLKVSFLGPAGGDARRIISEKEFGFLVLPQAYLNLDKLDISYTAVKTDEVPDTGGDVNDPGVQNQGIGASTYIYRGHNRVIVKLAGANDETKNQLKSSFDAKTLKFNYGTDKNNLDKTAKVYFDTKDSKYYAVLRDLKGGEKDGYNKDGFSDGRMQYYYQFKAGNSDIFLDAEKQNTVGDFKTLNRKRTVLYYYNWIFDRKYDLNKDYAWADVQDGGVNFWYDTNITLPGIRFMMLNDRRYKEFNTYLNKKKTTKKLVAWLYKKGLDRIYDDNLYKFADDNGVNYWYRQMTKIRKKDRISKEGAKFAISASTEARNQLQELFNSKNEANAEFSYNVVLKRGGDQGGVDYLIDTFKDSQKRMREDLANSFEYNNRLETIEKEGGRKSAIAELYETLYARPADVSGVDYWAESNQTIPQIKEDFLKSNEFINVLK